MKKVIIAILMLYTTISTGITIQNVEVVYGFAVNKPNLEKKTPIFNAALLSSPMAYKFNIDPIFTKNIPLDKQFDEFKRLIEEENVDINSTDWQGDTLLSYAVTYKIEPVFDYLLEKGANVNIGRINPLISATENNRIEYVKKLLDKGAHVNVKSKSGQTPLDIAEMKQYNQLAQIIREKGGKKSSELN